METAQILILVVVVALALLLIILGVQVFLILRELKNSVMKVNKVLDDAGVISESVATPVANLSGVIGGFKAGVSLLNLLKKKKKTKHFVEVVEEDDGEGA